MDSRLCEPDAFVCVINLYKINAGEVGVIAIELKENGPAVFTQSICNPSSSYLSVSLNGKFKKFQV